MSPLQPETKDRRNSRSHSDVTILFAGFPAVVLINVDELKDEGTASDNASATRQDVPANQALLNRTLPTALWTISTR